MYPRKIHLKGFCEKHKKIAGVFDHQNLPTKEILKYLSAERTMENTPLFDTVFVLQNNQKEKLAYRNFKLKPRKSIPLKLNLIWLFRQKKWMRMN